MIKIRLSAGFTLIEILMTVVIIAITAIATSLFFEYQIKSAKMQEAQLGYHTDAENAVSFMKWELKLAKKRTAVILDGGSPTANYAGNEIHFEYYNKQKSMTTFVGYRYDPIAHKIQRMQYDDLIWNEQYPADQWRFEKPLKDLIIGVQEFVNAASVTVPVFEETDNFTKIQIVFSPNGRKPIRDGASGDTYSFTVSPRN